MQRAALSTVFLLLLLATPGCSRVAHDRRELVADDVPVTTAMDEDVDAAITEAAGDEEFSTAPPAAEPFDGDRDATHALVKAVQSRLIALGFAPGYPDGALGARTRAALTSFQRDHRLPATGAADMATLAALFDEEPDVPDGEIVRTAGIDAAPTHVSQRPRLTRMRTFGFGAGIGFLCAAALAAMALVSRRRA